MNRRKMILLPGLDGTGELFAPLVRALPQDFEPRIVSYPNEPVKSYDELVPLVLRAIPPDEPVLLAAESFSGPLAIRIAATSPKNLEALILCATFAGNPLPGADWLRFLIGPPLFKLPPPRFLLRHMLLGADCPAALVDQFFKVARLVKPEVVASRIRLVLAIDEKHSLRACTMPILYLRASRDRLIGNHSADTIQRLNRRVRKVEIDAPHLLFQREPEKAVAAIQEFLAQREVGRSDE